MFKVFANCRRWRGLYHVFEQFPYLDAIAVPRVYDHWPPDHERERELTRTQYRICSQQTAFSFSRVISIIGGYRSSLLRRAPKLGERACKHVSGICRGAVRLWYNSVFPQMSWNRARRSKIYVNVTQRHRGKVVEISYDKSLSSESERRNRRLSTCRQFQVLVVPGGVGTDGQLK